MKFKVGDILKYGDKYFEYLLFNGMSRSAAKEIHSARRFQILKFNQYSAKYFVVLVEVDLRDQHYCRDDSTSIFVEDESFYVVAGEVKKVEKLHNHPLTGIFK